MSTSILWPAISLRDNRYDFSLFRNGGFLSLDPGVPVSFQYVPGNLSGLFAEEDAIREQFRQIRTRIDLSFPHAFDGYLLVLPFPSLRRCALHLKTAEEAGIPIRRILSPTQAAVLGLYRKKQLPPEPGRPVITIDGIKGALEATLSVTEHEVVEVLATVGVSYAPGGETKAVQALFQKLAHAAGSLAGNTALYYQTTFPASAEMLTALFQVQRQLSPTGHLSSYPEETACLGAAYYAGTLTRQGDTDGLLLLNVLTWRLTLYGANGDPEELVAPQTTIPTKESLLLPARKLADRFGHVNCLLAEKDLDEPFPASLSLPIYDLWDGKDQKAQLEFSASVDADSFFSLRIRNPQNQKEILRFGKDLFLELGANAEEALRKHRKKEIPADPARDYTKYPVLSPLKNL